MAAFVAEHGVQLLDAAGGVVAKLADRITVLNRGEVLAEGVYDEVSKNPAVMEAYMGVKAEEVDA